MIPLLLLLLYVMITIHAHNWLTYNNNPNTGLTIDDTTIATRLGMFTLNNKMVNARMNHLIYMALL